MRLKLTLVLILLNAGLFGYLFYLETASPRAQGEARGRLILPPGVVDHATQLSLSGDRVAQPWVLRRQAGRWEVEQPVAWPANPYAVRRLVDLLTFLQWETRFTVEDLQSSGKTLADYGLREGAAQLEITSGDNIVKLRVGAPTEIGQRVYVLSPDGREVFVVDRGLLEGMNLTADSLINASVIEIPTFEVESLNLTIGPNNGVRVQMARPGDRWVFHAPVRAPADSDRVDVSLDQLYQLEATAFTSLTPAAAGLNNPELRLNINGNGRQQTLFLGNIVDPDAYPVLRYARLEARPTVFTVPSEPFDVWFEAQESLRQRRFMDFPASEVGSLEIRLDDRAITLQRLESGGWQVVQAVNGTLTTRPADSSVVRAVIERVANLEALRFVSDAPSSADLERYGFNDPQRRVFIRLLNGESRTLVLGDFVFEGTDNTSRNRIYSKREAQPPVYLSSASILAELPLNGLHYRERVAGTLPAGAIVSTIRLRDIVSGTVLLEARRGSEGWVPTISGATMLETGAALDAIVQAVRRFPVERFIADRFSDPLILDSQRTVPWVFMIEAEVQLPGGDRAAPEVRRYYLTERLGGTTQYGGSPSVDAAFELTQGLIDALNPLLFTRPRPDLPYNPDPVTPAEPEPIEDPVSIEQTTEADAPATDGVPEAASAEHSEVPPGEVPAPDS